MASISIFGICATFLYQMLSDNYKHSAKINNIIDVQMAKKTILSMVDCEKTMSLAPNTSICESPSAMIFLKDKNNNVIGNPSELFNGGYQFVNAWYVKSTCVGSGLEVRLAKKQGADFAVDPLVSAKSLSFTNSAINPIFGSPPAAFSLCSSASSVTFSKGRYHSGNTNGRPFFRVLSGETSDFIIGPPGSLCSNPDLVGASYETGGGSLSYLVDPGQCSEYVLIQCNSANDLEIVSCATQGTNSSDGKIHMYENGCAAWFNHGSSATIICKSLSKKALDKGLMNLIA